MVCFSLIPYVGILIGGVSTLLFAVATADTGRIVAVLALLVALQLFEALVVRRRVDPATVYVGPALPLIVMLIGWSLYGLGGAICSVLLLMLASGGGPGGGRSPRRGGGDAGRSGRDRVEPIGRSKSRQLPA